MNKHYVFNETGNILLCSTSESIHNFDEDIKDTFIDVSVFFTAMTKALHTTENPKNPGKTFSIYNYQAVKNVLNSSGMFIEINVEEGQFSSKGVGAPMGKELIQKILNRNFSESQLNFSKSMFNGMGYQQESGNTHNKLDNSGELMSRSGNIFFVCELLLGLPQTTTILVELKPESTFRDSKEKDSDFQNIFDLGKKDESRHQSKGKLRYWNYKKRTYLFIPPKFLKSNIANLTSANSGEVDDLIESLSEKLLKMTETNMSH